MSDESRYRLQYQYNPLPLFTWRRVGADFVLSEWNEAAERLTEGQISQLRGQRAAELYRDEPQIIDAFKRCIHEQRVVRSETEYRLRSTGEIKSLVSTFLWLPPDLVNVCVEDVTSRRRTEDELRARELRFRSLIEFSEDAIALIDHNGQILYVSPSTERVLAYPPKELLHQSIFELFHPDDLPAVHSLFTRILESPGQAFAACFRCRNAEGQWRWLEGLGRNLLQMSEVGAIVINYRDVTDRRISEAETHAQADRAESLLRFAAKLGAQRNLAQVLRLACEEAAHALNRSVAAIYMFRSDINALQWTTSVGLNPSAGQPRPLSRDWYERCTGRVRGRIHLANLKRRSDLPDRDWYIERGLRFMIAAPLADGPRLLGLFSVFGRKTDLPFQKAEQALLGGLADQAALAVVNAKLFEEVASGRERLKALSQQLLQTQEDQRQAIARELHDEIGQTLTALQINLDTVRQQALPPNLEDRISESVAMTAQILQQIKRLSLDLRPSMLDDLGLVAALRWYATHHGERAGLKVHFKAEPANFRIHPLIETALFRIGQEAFTNVFRHARATRLDVLLERRLDCVVLEVRDNGVGFDIESQRGRTGHSRPLGILGMEERASLIGGDIIIRSQPEQGTLIQVSARLSEDPSLSSGQSLPC